MKKQLFLLSLIILNSFVFSQTFQWAKSFGGGGTDVGYSLTVDASGNVYTTGYFSGTSDFDPGIGVYNLTSSGSSIDIFISKLDASGNFVWAKRIGGTNVDIGYSLVVDVSGNTYTTGVFEGTVDFDPGAGTFELTSENVGDAFILKLNAAGNFVWVKRLGGAYLDQSYSICLDAAKNIYTTGSFGGTTDFDPGTGIYNLTASASASGKFDVFVSKLDSFGNFVWARNMGGTDNDVGNSIAVDAGGNVYSAGIFKVTADFDPGSGTSNLVSAGKSDFYISKLDASGNFAWAKRIGGTSDDEVHSISIDASGNVYSVGFYSGTVDFDPGTGTANLTTGGGFILKLNSSGNFVWAKKHGETAPYSIVNHASGYFYTAGNYSGTVDFDPGTGTFNLAAIGDPDIFISKFDQSGNFVWAKSMGGSGSDYCKTLVVDISGNIYTSGYYAFKGDFDPGNGTFEMTSKGDNDIFISKLGNCSLTITGQPNNQSVNAGSTTRFTTVASSLTATYQWQENTGTNFVNLSDGGLYSGVKNDTLTIINVALSQNNYSYRCVITDGNCMDTTNNAILNVKSVGIKILNKNQNIEVYPNPSTNFIIILADNNFINLPYNLTDAAGREILSGTLNDKSTSIDIGNLISGFYYLKVGELNGELFKVIKQ